MRDLTPRQREVLNYIAAFIDDEQRPPTIRDVQRYFNFASPNGVLCHLEALDRKGWIQRSRGSSRGIRLLK